MILPRSCNYDLYYSFDKASGEDLGWFWKPWFFEFGYADISIGEVKQDEKGITVQINNAGGFPIPVNLIAKYADGSQKTITARMSVWRDGRKHHILKIPMGKLQELVLDTDTPEAFYDNNKRRFN